MKTNKSNKKKIKYPKEDKDGNSQNLIIILKIKNKFGRIFKNEKEMDTLNLKR